MKSGGCSVRQALPADLARIVELERGIAEAPHWAEAEYGVIVGGSEANGAVRRCLLVSEIGNRVVGFAVGRALGLLGEIESVAVACEARRVGCGRELCEAVVEWCRGQGAREIDLEVRAGSGGAIGLYEDLGFVRIGLRRGYYREPSEDAVLMQMKLEG